MNAPTDLDAWPAYSWDVPDADAVGAFSQRVREIAERVRAFELVVAQAADQGEVDLLAHEEPLAQWDERAETVFMYAGLCRDGEVEAAAVPIFVEELAPTYGELRALREVVYKQLGAKAARLQKLEAATKVTAEQIDERIEVLDSMEHDEASDAPAEDGEDEESAEAEGPDAAPAVATARSDEEIASDDPFDVPVAPVSFDELRMRQTAESKLLPAKLELVDLLAHLPSEWVIAVFETLDLVEEENEELAGRPKSTRYRAQIVEALHDPEMLESVLDCVGEQACDLLKDLLAKKGMADYRALCSKWGSDDKDGFFWAERPPATALSRLRRTGLVYVGAGRGGPVAAVPIDLAPMLSKLLAKAT